MAVLAALLTGALAVPVSPVAAAVPMISTVAGGGLGEGAATRFPQEPGGLALRGSTLYVADVAGLVVRALDLTTGRQRVVAGNGSHGSSGDGGPARSAQLYPGAVAVDAAGSLYISDTPNHRVRKVDGSGTIRTVVGTGVGAFGGDGGPATAARLASPAGLAFDAAGNLYIAEAGNWRVRKVTPQGVITTIAGNGERGEAGDGGPATAAQMEPAWTLAVDGQGNVYVGSSNRVRRISAAGIITTVAGNGSSGREGDGGPALAAQMDGPGGITLDGAGNLYLSDYWNVRRVDTAGIITSWVGRRSPFGEPFSGDGGPATEARVHRPSGVVAGPGGALYVADAGNGRVRMVDASGVISTIAGNGSQIWGGDGGPATEAQLGGPRAVAVDGGGNLFVLDSYVRRIDPSGTISAFAGNPANAGNQFGGDGGPATEALLSGPVDVATDGAGNVYIAEGLANRVRKVDPDGIITTVAGSGPAPSMGGGYAGDGGPATAASLSGVAGVAVEPDGNVYIADSGNNRIRRVDTEGIITTVAGNGTVGFSGDGGPATGAQLNGVGHPEIDPFGNLYFVDFGNNRVRRVDAGGTITTVASGQQFGGVALDGAGRAVVSWMTLPSPFDPSAWRMQVGRVEDSGALTPIAGLGAGFAGDGGPAKDARFYYPYDVAFDAGNQLYVADGLNRRVRRITNVSVAAADGDHTVKFIARAYVDVLGRLPTAAELGFWGPLLTRGLPRDWVGGTLVTSAEFRLLASVSLYWDWLGRAPSAAEAKALADRLAAGTRLEEAWAELAGSEASWVRHGRDAGAYVDSLYRRAFGRDPDAAGRAFWVDKLRQGYSRATAALAFAFNPAASSHLVELSSGRFLGREPDDAGAEFWVGHLQAGMRSEYLFAFFAGSDEYYARAITSPDAAIPR